MAAHVKSVALHECDVNLAVCSAPSSGWMNSWSQHEASAVDILFHDQAREDSFHPGKKKGGS